MTPLALDQPRMKTIAPYAMIVGALLAPIAILDFIAFFVPLANLAWISIHEAIPTGGVGKSLSLDSWKSLLQDTYDLKLMWRSVWMSTVVTFFALLCSYPIAWYVNRAKGTFKAFLTILVITPLLTSTVVRSYGWIALLGEHGVVLNFLTHFGYTGQTHLLYNMTGVIIGLTEIQMPYMILAIVIGLGRVDPFIEEAASILGAKPLTVFLRIVLPVSLPGAALGCLFCFVHSVSSFITPQILGGARVNVLATEIFDQASMLLNWPLASVVSILVLIIFGVALFAYSRASSALE